ncbi:MAG: ABC transporter permease, partial [Clostridia bacterium]|nr:ABC transporter permease [Clostridia bacterium]
MKNKRFDLKKITEKEGFRSASASLLSVLIGVTAGAVIIMLIALLSSEINFKNGIEGVKLLFFGVFSKGRNPAGELLFGFNGTNAGNMLFR